MHWHRKYVLMIYKKINKRDKFWLFSQHIEILIFFSLYVFFCSLTFCFINCLVVRREWCNNVPFIPTRCIFPRSICYFLGGGNLNDRVFYMDWRWLFDSLIRFEEAASMHVRHLNRFIPSLHCLQSVFCFVCRLQPADETGTLIGWECIPDVQGDKDGQQMMDKNWIFHYVCLCVGSTLPL